MGVNDPSIMVIRTWGQILQRVKSLDATDCDNIQEDHTVSDVISRSVSVEFSTVEINDGFGMCSSDVGTPVHSLGDSVEYVHTGALDPKIRQGDMAIS